MQKNDRKTSLDQTGLFLVLETSGNKYLFLLFDYDSNSIMVEGMPSRTKHQLKTAYKRCVKRLQQRGLALQLQTLDNESSKHLKTYMLNQNIKFQYTPVGSHR